jgi:hypothetical protein
MWKSSIYARDIITVCFDYHGDLGVLQQKTRDNIETINNLRHCAAISELEAKEVRADCKNYFKEEIQKVLDSPSFFIEV